MIALKCVKSFEILLVLSILLGGLIETIIVTSANDCADIENGSETTLNVDEGENVTIITTTTRTTTTITTANGTETENTTSINELHVDYNENGTIPGFGDMMSNSELQLTDTKAQNRTKLGIKLKKLLNCVDRELKTSRTRYGRYWLLQNIIRGELSRYVGCAETVTFTTHGDYTYIKHLLTLVKRWYAPISFAVFAPGRDFNSALIAIQYIRHCREESELIRRFVSFHIYFPVHHMPTFVPINESDATNWQYDCQSEDTPIDNAKKRKSYRYIHKIAYPINAGRNIARQFVNTHFIFACDIELFPSPGLPLQFLELIARNRSVYFERGPNQRVFAMPVFELQSYVTLPTNKIELMRMLEAREAVLFHASICYPCHVIPQQKAWELANVTELRVFTVTKREHDYVHWEPFYISDNREPLFDERLNREETSNKRLQGHAMCLLKYEYHVLHPAFLVHAPGIKLNKKQSTHVLTINKFIQNKILPQYRIFYGNNRLCQP